MPTIILTSSEHYHIEEDITNQVDGYKFTFTTKQDYESGSLCVIYAGISYTKNNDFYEIDEYGITSNKKFTLVNDNPFPPQPDVPLYIIYRKLNFW